MATWSSRLSVVAGIACLLLIGCSDDGEESDDSPVTVTVTVTVPVAVPVPGGVPAPLPQPLPFPSDDQTDELNELEDLNAEYERTLSYYNLAAASCERELTFQQSQYEQAIERGDYPPSQFTPASCTSAERLLNQLNSLS